jgi:hypothetical protein
MWDAIATVGWIGLAAAGVTVVGLVLLYRWRDRS